MTTNPKLAPGDDAPDFTLPDTNPTTSPGGVGAKTVSLADVLKGRRGALVIWMCNHCPYVVGSATRIAGLAYEYMPKGLGVVGICSNDASTHPEDSAEKMAEYAAKWRLPFPYLRDESQEAARAYGAERTPEIFLLDAAGVCVYEGAIDDSPKDAIAVKDQPLRDAIEDLLAGKPVRRPQVASIGCTIKWKQG
ncbi:MAG: thioredoxin family protein [Phycisphaerales bacterium]|nr:MAG: thioredoxin family protein [Phycisphaerales bacterium]